MKNKKYAVMSDIGGRLSDALVIIEAIDEKEALKKAMINHFLDYEIFREILLDEFWKSNDYENFFVDENGNVYDEDRNVSREYIDEVFECNLAIYFKYNSECVGLLLEYYKNRHNECMDEINQKMLDSNELILALYNNFTEETNRDMLCSEIGTKIKVIK